MSSFIKMSGSVLSGSQDGSGYSLGVSELQVLDGFADAALVETADSIVFFDATDSRMKRESVADFLGAIDGQGLGVASSQLALDAAQTGLTSILNTSLVVGRDATDQVKFSTDNEIIFRVDGGDNVKMKTGGAIEAVSLDISGDVDVDGTMEADAYTVDGTALNEYIADTAGAMFSSNTETGISVTYQDADNTIDLALDAAQTTITSVLNAGLTVGRDSDNVVDFATADDVIILKAAGSERLRADDAGVDVTGALTATTTISASSNLSAGGAASFAYGRAGVSALGAITSSVGMLAAGDSSMAAAGGFLHVGNGYIGTGMSLSSAGALNMKGALQVDSNAAFDGNVDLGSNDSDTITANGLFDSDLVPSADSLRDLGSASKQWAEAHVDAGHIDILKSSTLQAADGTAAGSIADSTGVVTLGSSVLTTTDINGGTIDGADVTVGSGKTLNVSAGTLTTSNAQAVALMKAGAANMDADLDFQGNDLRAATLTADGLTATQVVFAGANGLLSSDSDMTFSGDTLTVTKLGAFEAAGAINFANQAMTNVDINSGAIDGTTLGAASAASAKVTSLSSSAGVHISAKSGPYALSIADGAGEAIAEAWVTHSDRNLKTNIQAMDNNVALNAVMNLQPATYEKVASGKSEIGFIAQDVAQVVPEICALDANGIGRGIDYSRMSTLLAGALKAQQEQIAQLKEIVAKLQK